MPGFDLYQFLYVSDHRSATPATTGGDIVADYLGGEKYATDSIGAYVNVTGGIPYSGSFIILA